jgi:phosphate transport system permease protein
MNDTPRTYIPQPVGRRLIKDRLFLALCVVVASASLIALTALLWSIAQKGLTYLSWHFLSDVPSRRPSKAGIGPAMWGTIWACLVCAFFALPLGVGTAIFLEEFKPKRRWLRRVHGFVQLNISNLAGVPSIVYGILGMTVFVQMFGVFGNANSPTWEIGSRWYDQFQTVDGRIARVPIEHQDSPETAVLDGLSGMTAEGEEITLHVASASVSPPLPWTIAADTRPQRTADKKWYYMQLPFGRSVLAGGLTLMLVTLPIMIISAQEALRAVPNSLREGALAAGATKWQMVSKMTLPAAVPGIMTGAILAMSRAIGEAAPMLIIAGVVYITFTPSHLMDKFTVMPLQIYSWAGLPQEDFHKVAASGIIVLLAILLTFNALAVFIRQKFQKPLQ